MPCAWTAPRSELFASLPYCDDRETPGRSSGDRPARGRRVRTSRRGVICGQADQALHRILFDRYGYDTYGRLLARHLGKYLPGNPAIIPQNRPGAGSLNLANYIYSAAPNDGSEIAMVGRGVAMEPLIGASASQGKFDSRKFVWPGSMNNEVSGFFIRQGAPAANLREILAGTPLQVGSTGAAGDQQAFTVALNSLLGTRLKPIAGYPGTQEILLAIERGELDGIVGYSWGVARAGNKDDLASGRLKIVMQLGLAKHRTCPTFPCSTSSCMRQRTGRCWT